MRICTIDFETLGLHPHTAPLLDFGYYMGDTTRPAGPPLHSGRIIISSEINKEMNRSIELPTLNWWVNKIMQDTNLGIYFSNILEASQSITTTHTLIQISKFCTQLATHSIEGIFCTDKSFDMAILLSILHKYDIPICLNYKHYFETRLHQQILDPDSFTHPNTLTHHTAYDDAVWLFESIAKSFNG